MIGAELHLESVGRDGMIDRHHAGIRDDAVQSAIGTRNTIRERPYTGERSEIDLADVELGVRNGPLYRGSGSLPLVKRAHGQDDGCAARCQHASGLLAQPRGCACDEIDLAGQVNAGEDLFGGRFAIEAKHAVH